MVVVVVVVVLRMSEWGRKKKIKCEMLSFRCVKTMKTIVCFDLIAWRR